MINHWAPASIENPLPLNFSSLLTERGEWATRSHFERIFAQILDSEQNSSRFEDPAIAVDYHFLHFWDLNFGLCLLNNTFVINCPSIINKLINQLISNNYLPSWHMKNILSAVVPSFSNSGNSNSPLTCTPL